MTRCLASGCQRPATEGGFCVTHAKAPAGQRGGWLSAARRKPYDATPVSPRLWIGTAPPLERDLPTVDILVLCAAEIQTDHLAFHGQLVRCPIPDADLTLAQVELALKTSVTVAKAIVEGKRVLVTCANGQDRSALVVACALHQLTTMSGDQIVAHIRKQRGEASLRNRWFVAKILEIVGDGRPKVRRKPS